MTQKTYYAEVVLAPFPQSVGIAGVEATELSYYVLEVDAVSGKEQAFYSGLDTQHIFCREDRPGVMVNIGICVGRALQPILDAKRLRRINHINGLHQ